MIRDFFQRSGDRSWKQIWAALKGPKLFLHKDKHHQVSVMTYAWSAERIPLRRRKKAFAFAFYT